MPSIVAPVSILRVPELRLLENASNQDIVNNLNANFTVEDFKSAFSIISDKDFKLKMIELLNGIDENLRNYIPLREMKPPSIAGSQSRGDRN